MPAQWTSEQVLALAPDASSAKAGKELATARKWLSLGREGEAAWGECQGSGKSPYQAQIDLSEPAFRCTCPSRKFPCKHALGLFLILANQPGAFREEPAPAWVTEWLASRAQRAQQREQRQEERAAQPVDPSAQARRAAQRETRVAAGLQELERWLRDLVRRGLASAQGEPYSFWDAPAARLVDAQAPGLARQLREMAGIPSSGEGWQERLLDRLGRLHLLLEGYRRIETLPAETQADIRALIGWTQSQEELLAGQGLRDWWRVVGQRTEEEDRLRVERTWLQGQASGRFALVLQFAPHGQVPERSLILGTVLDAELVFFPGAYPLRALVKRPFDLATSLDALPGQATITEAMKQYAEAVAHNPWLERFPMTLDTVTPLQRSGGWSVRDPEGRALPLSPRFRQGWLLSALTGGHRLAVFGEWNGDYLQPLSLFAEGTFYGVMRSEPA
jgi:hypothetical protein